MCPRVEYNAIRSAKPIYIKTRPKASKLELEKKAKWYRPGEKYIINEDIIILKGNFYADGYVLSKSYATEGTSIFKDRELSEIGDIGFFSSYCDMTPYARYRYLLWLSGRATLDETPIDLVFFYVYGNCFRLFLDKETSIEEKTEIILELIKLRDL